MFGKRHQIAENRWLQLEWGVNKDGKSMYGFNVYIYDGPNKTEPLIIFSKNLLLEGGK